MSEPSFSGSVPEMYDKGLVPLIFEDYAEDLVRRLSVPEGGRVLELACGTGVVSRRLRSHLPESVELVATDISPDMMSVAERSLAGHGGVSFQIEDATALSFEDASFDAVLCQFGVMFFPDKQEAYAEVARVLKPSGTFLFNVWDSLENNPIFGCAHEVLHSLFPEDPPMFLQIPFGYYDTDEIVAATRRAGFATEFCVLPGTSRAPSARDVAETLTKGTPLAPMLAEIDGEHTAAVLADAVSDLFGQGPIEAPMQAVVFSSRKRDERD